MSQRYYPLNFFFERAYVRRIFKKLCEIRGGLTPAVSQKIVLDELVPWLRQQGWGHTPGKNSDMTCISQELQGALAWGDWAMKGKEVVHVDKDLTQAFSLSKCADMRISDVLDSTPSSTYIHFDGAAELRLEVSPGAFFKGAYVISYPETALRIVLCANLPANSLLQDKWQERYDLRVASKYFDLPAQEAVDYALSDDLQDIRIAMEQLEERNAMNEALSAKTLMDRMSAGNQTFSKALALIMNALAYQKHYASDAATRWPENTPERLLNQVVNGTPKEKARSESKLWELGFVPVKYVGEAFAQTLIRNTEKGSVRAHWREGHWRSQAHGPQFSLRKLIWLRPTLVGAANLDA